MKEAGEEEEDLDFEDYEEMELEWTSITSEQPQPWDSQVGT